MEIDQYRHKSGITVGSNRQAQPVGLNDDHVQYFTFEQLRAYCNLSVAQAEDYVSAGVISPVSVGSKLYSDDQRIRLRMACQLKTDFEIEPSGAVVALHHLENVAVLEKRMSWLGLVCLEQQSVTIQ